MMTNLNDKTFYVDLNQSSSTWTGLNLNDMPTITTTTTNLENVVEWAKSLTTAQPIIIINVNQPMVPYQSADPCESCPNKDGPKDAFGNPIVGDSPCQWCQHYKYKITW